MSDDLDTTLSPELAKLLEQTTVSKSVIQLTADYRYTREMLLSIDAPLFVPGMDGTEIDLALSIIGDAYNKELADRPQPRQRVHKLPPTRPL